MVKAICQRWDHLEAAMESVASVASVGTVQHSFLSNILQLDETLKDFVLLSTAEWSHMSYVLLSRSNV